VTRVYSGQGSIIVPPHKVRASTPWGKRNLNPSRSRSGVVTITDKDGNTRIVAPLIASKSGVVRLPGGRKARLSGSDVVTLDLSEAQEREVLARLRSDRANRGVNLNIHEK
jgi:ethanolamine utilization microcompartment shell protein EutS